VDELGLARSPNGLLLVIWPKVVKPDSDPQIWHTRISPQGIAGGRSLVSGSWNAAGGPKLLASPAGLRVFFAGLGGSNENGGIQSATAGHDGGTWKKEPGHVSTDVNAAGTVGAASLKDGTPVFAWASGSRLFVHTGIDPAKGEQEIGPGPSCCWGWPELATDTQTGVTTLAYGSIVQGKGGLFVRQVKPSLGSPKLVPKSLTGNDYVLVDQRLPLVAREGGGVFLAYCSGYPTCGQVLFWRVGGGAPLLVAKAHNLQDVNASRGPEGRIWVTWWDRDAQKVLATRSNRKASKFGPVVQTSLPPGADHVWKLFGEGSAGPLDVLASAGNPSAYWHTQLLPKLTVGCSKTGKTVVTCKVTDAGDPVPGASVRLAGLVETTPATGAVQFTTTSASLAAVATKKGYADG
jgi:hypothetical protein